MKIIQKLIFLGIVILLIYEFNYYYFPYYNDVLEGMCDKTPLCDFKPLDGKLKISNIPPRSENNVDPTTTLNPQLLVPDNSVPVWPKQSNNKNNDQKDTPLSVDSMTHLPTTESIKPFIVKKPPKVNQPYQQLFKKSEFTVNYPCHPSITGAFTTCGPNGFSGFCPASNNYSEGGI